MGINIEDLGNLYISISCRHLFYIDRTWEHECVFVPRSFPNIDDDSYTHYCRIPLNRAVKTTIEVKGAAVRDKEGYNVGHVDLYDGEIKVYIEDKIMYHGVR